MKVTIKKLLSLIVIPAALIYLDIMLSSMNMTLWSILTIVVINIAVIISCYLLYSQHKDTKFTIHCEYVPMCCIGIGIEGGAIGIIFPFFVIAFGWTIPYDMSDNNTDDTKSVGSY